MTVISCAVGLYIMEYARTAVLTPWPIYVAYNNIRHSRRTYPCIFVDDSTLTESLKEVNPAR